MSLSKQYSGNWIWIAKSFQLNLLKVTGFRCCTVKYKNCISSHRNAQSGLVKKNLVEGNPFEIEILILLFVGVLTSSLEYRGEYYFFAFRFAKLLSLLTLPLLSFFFGAAALPMLGAFLTRSRSLP